MTVTVLKRLFLSGNISLSSDFHFFSGTVRASTDALDTVSRSQSDWGALYQQKQTWFSSSSATKARNLTWYLYYKTNSSNAMYSVWLTQSPQHCRHPHNCIVLSAWRAKGREGKWDQILLPSALLWNQAWFIISIKLQPCEDWVLLTTKESVQMTPVMLLQMAVLSTFHRVIES